MLAVMMLRGPQTPGELLAAHRAPAPLPRHGGAARGLDRLKERELVARYDRRPGQREDRYGAPARRRGRGAGLDRPAAAAPAAAAPRPRDDDRLDRLERELAELRAEVAALREELGA